MLLGKENKLKREINLKTNREALCLLDIFENLLNELHHKGEIFIVPVHLDINTGLAYIDYDYYTHFRIYKFLNSNFLGKYFNLSVKTISVKENVTSISSPNYKTFYKKASVLDFNRDINNKDLTEEIIVLLKIMGYKFRF